MELEVLYRLLQKDHVIHSCSTRADAMSTVPSDYDAIVVDVLLSDSNSAEDTLEIVRHFGADKCVVHSALHPSMPEIQGLKGKVRIVPKNEDLTEVHRAIREAENA